MHSQQFFSTARGCEGKESSNVVKSDLFNVLGKTKKPEYLDLAECDSDYRCFMKP